MSTIIPILIFSAISAGLAGWLGLSSLKKDGEKSKWTTILMALSFVGQMWALYLRGEQRGSCPLMDTGEICLFLSWSLSMFYLVVGPTYRVSLLGMFSTPVVTFLLVIAALPNVMEVNPVHKNVVDYWGELHAALSVLSYGALGLGAVASCMFLVLHHFLKTGDMSSGLFQNMPPLHTLVSSMVRLTLVGLLFLTVGIVCGLYMKEHGGLHLWVAKAVWGSYIILMSIWFKRGMISQRMALLLILMFAASLSVFAAL